MKRLEIMRNLTESHTVQFTKEDRPLFDRFQLQLDRAELSRRQHQVVPEVRPDFGMTVPPVAERRIHPRNRSEREWQHRVSKKAQESHLGPVAA
jgi:hypothetical protein